MLLTSLTDGSVTGTDTLTLQGYILGGVLITADGSNDATVILRKDNSSGKQIFKLVTKTPAFIVGPISTEGTKSVYYSVSGTGGAAQIYEWTT